MDGRVLTQPETVYGENGGGGGGRYGVGATMSRKSGWRC